MSTDPVRRANLGAIECEPRQQLPDGFKRSSTRVGATLGAGRTGSASTSYLPARRSAPTTTKIQTRNGPEGRRRSRVVGRSTAPVFRNDPKGDAE